MKKVIKTLAIRTLIAGGIAAGLLIFSLCHYVGAEEWEEVVPNGFGEPSNDYAWSMATFRGKLYVGTLNSNRGAEIWSSSSGEVDTWERVYNTLTTSNLGIRCMYADEDRFLYACTSNVAGTEVMRTEDGYRWTTVGRKGLGDMRNSSIRCILRFGEYLYAGTGSKMAKLYRSKDGSAWELIDAQPGFETTIVNYPRTRIGVTNNILIGELAVFKNQLYAFTWTDDFTAIRGPFSRSMPKDPFLRAPNKTSVVQNSDDGNLVESIYGIWTRRSTKPEFSRAPGAFEVWRSSDGLNWEKVVGQDDAYGNGMGFSGHDPENLANDLVTSVAVFNEKLYLGTMNGDGKTSVWRTSNGTSWEKVLDFFKMGEEYNFYIWRMIPFNGRLFIGTMNMGSEHDPGVTGAQIWASDSGDADSFYCLVHNGFGSGSIRVAGISMPKNYGIRSFGILNNTLFVGTATMLSIAMPGPPFGVSIAGRKTGCEIWKLSENDQYSSVPSSLPVPTGDSQLPVEGNQSPAGRRGTGDHSFWWRVSGTKSVKQ
ncbi:MAG: hypothetical protein AB1847_15915 [bacterium]